MDKKLYVIANAHLDTQWNWTIQKTIESYIKDTLEQNFELIEKFPHYRMNFEGAFRYKLAKEYYPDLYERLKGYIAQGRWNVAGSSWDANDANVPSSEAFMRQILYGNGYFEREFGKKSTDIFLPDCFGFRYSLPSIAAHMGLNGFSTQKLAWGVGTPVYNDDGTVSKPMLDNEHDRMDLGRWQGPDGKSVLVTMHAEDYTYQFDRRGDSRPVNERDEQLKQIELNEKHTGVAAKSKYYGVGDVGGAAGENCARMVEEACNSNGGLYEVVSASSDQLFNELTAEQIEKMPVYDGGLPIPHGSGALTSRAICKRWNRKCELLADSAERASVMAQYLCGKAYPKERLRTAWETFLWHQFHDDLTGTSIVEAYSFTYNDYIIALNTFASELSASIEAISAGLNTQVEGTPILVFNTASAERKDIVTAEISLSSKNVRVFNADGEEVPSQLHGENGKTFVRFVANVSPVSCTVFDVRESDVPCQIKTSLKASSDALENGRYIVKLDENGDIYSITDKKDNGRELLSAPVRFEIGEDISLVYPSWELNPDDLKKEPEYVTELKSVEITDCGPAAVSLTVKRIFDKSEFTQVISLYEGSDRVDVDNSVEWHQRKSMLRAAYKLNVSNENASFDLGLGTDYLPNSEYPYFQNTVHQWADLTDSDGSYGVSILNDCKYGMDKPDDNTLRLTLIHTPSGAFSDDSMQDFQDMGTNIFKYSIVGHAGAPELIPAEAEAVNQPLMPFVTDKHSGKSGEISFVSCSRETVAVRAVKQEEKGKRIIVRVQETAGKNAKAVQLRFAGKIKSAEETNGYEDSIGSVAFSDSVLTFDISRFAPMTFAVELENTAEERPDNGIALPLPFTKQVTSPNSNKTAGEFAKGIAIPAELYNENVTVGGISFKLAPADTANAVACGSQRIRIPAGAKKLCLLAASANGDKNAEFSLDGKPYPVKIQDFQENVGTWDVPISNIRKNIKRDEIALNFTHTHDKNGDRLYLFANIFKYCIPVDGVKELTLPCDEDIIIMAATAVMSNGFVLPAAYLYDNAEPENKPMHKLTVIDNGKIKTSLHPENSRLLITRHAPYDPVLGLFKGYEGSGVVGAEDGVTLVDMKYEDIAVNAVYERIGTYVPFDCDSCHANCFNGQQELPIEAITANVRKWCASHDTGDYWLEIKLEKPAEISHWLVAHAGIYEDEIYNSREFSLEYKFENSEWKTADAVTDNTDKITCRSFDKVMADTVRLVVANPSQTDDKHARIYFFQVYAD